MDYWKNRCDRVEIQPNGVGARIPTLIEVEALAELTELPPPVLGLLDRVHAITWRVFYGDGQFIPDTVVLDPHVFQRANGVGLKAIRDLLTAAKARQLAGEVHSKSKSVDYPLVLGRALAVSLSEGDLSEDSLHEILAAHQAAILKVFKGRTYVHSHQAEKDSQVRDLLLIGGRAPRSLNRMTPCGPSYFSGLK